MTPKRLIFIFYFICFTIGIIKSQETDKALMKRNSFYAEILGTSGSVCSVNYDRVLSQKGNIFTDLTVGFGYFPFIKDMDPIFGVPVSINVSSGLRNHHFEMGVGLTYNSGIAQRSSTYDAFGSNFSSYSTTESLEALFCSFRLGYKYQKPSGGLFIRAGFTPLLKIITFSAYDEATSVFPLFGLGVGYTM